MLVELLTDPDEFFERAAADDGLAKPAGVILLVGVVGALSSLPVLRATVAAMPPEAGSFATLAYVFGIGGALVGAFVLWALYAGAMHVISTLAFDAEGSFRRTLAVTAWGFVPAILAAVVSGALTYVAFQSITIPSDPARAAGFAQAVQNDPILQLASVLGIVFLLWQGFLWTFAVSHARDLHIREAVITVSVPVGIDVLWRVFNLV